MKCKGNNVRLLAIFILNSLHLPFITGKFISLDCMFMWYAIFWWLFHNAGYLYFVKSSSHRGSVCYTNETRRAVSIIRDLNESKCLFIIFLTRQQTGGNFQTVVTWKIQSQTQPTMQFWENWIFRAPTAACSTGATSGWRTILKNWAT